MCRIDTEGIQLTNDSVATEAGRCKMSIKMKGILREPDLAINEGAAEQSIT